MSGQLHRCTAKMLMGRQSMMLRTATKPGQQRPISQLAASHTVDRLSAASPVAPAPVDYHARRFQIQGGTSLGCSRQAHQLLSTIPSSSSLHSVRWFSSDDKEEDDKSKKEETGKIEEKTEVKEEKKEEAKAGDEGAPDAPTEETPPKVDDAAAAAAAKPEAAEEDDCPPWMNPLHYNDPRPKKEFPEDFAPGEEMPILEAPPLADPNNPDKVLASQEVYDLADEIVNLSMLEMKELVTKIGDHFGFEKPPFTGSDGSGGGGDDDVEGGEDGAAEAAAAKTHFDIKLVSFDAKSKIKVIKEVRALAGLGLKEAKEMVEGAPKIVMKDIKKEQAEELQKKLEEVGAVVEIV